MTAQTFLLASSRESARRLACLWACQKIPAMANNLGDAEALRQLHPRPLRYGLAIYLAKTGNSRLDPVSVALVRGSELSQIGSGLASQRLAQMASGRKQMQATHGRLIADGYEWDGMDGYSKTL